MISGPPEFTAMNISPRPACPSHRPRAGRATGDPDAVLGPLFRCGNGTSGTGVPRNGAKLRPAVARRQVHHQQVLRPPREFFLDLRVVPLVPPQVDRLVALRASDAVDPPLHRRLLETKCRTRLAIHVRGSRSRMNLLPRLRPVH